MGSGNRYRMVSAAVTAMFVLVAIGGPAAGDVRPQLEDPTSLSPTSTTTSTTIAPADDPGSGEQQAPDVPPPAEIVVPEPEPASGAPRRDPRLRQALVVGESRARAELLRLDGELAVARRALWQQEAEAQQLQRRVARTRSRLHDTARQHATAMEQLAGRAANLYVQGPGELSFVLDAKDPNELLHRMALARSVLGGDQRQVRLAEAADDEANKALSEILRQMGGLIEQRRSLRNEVGVLAEAQRRQFAVFEMFRAGSLVGIAGFVFPVGDPHNFVDTFGAPRMTGTQYQHSHQGTDIFAPFGTPLYAVERGVISRVGTDVLGGTKLWLVGASGVRYYYAHLSGYAPGIAEGTVVEAGAVVGFVGNTGNARTTPPHLHFEIHPSGLGPVNPYPILSIADRYRAR